ncbi:protein Star-like [Zootermopsis nevadensis]|uniref:Protein Star n=1 Tax=Zootermopsis nevadensis TaxID=136037 RepID=A0A067RCX6_ZOONE|nr:protein Star-like [Zootermopsis nevadensis]XP_021925106.1 protein Star-like [Zootermopsis nevadensis]XP_021925107.1 protein Star-like [Zootermopsis nevadensis]XP_021925108.1 protein Star-like [Zootermopsis nevadensis]KDR16633.1 Protein Star [Zootermopsis nevadensis]
MVASSTPSLLRRLLPYAVFLTAFSVVMMVLLMAMDIRAPRRQAFNMTDLDFRNVAQDNPQFITYIRAVHLHLPSSSLGMRNLVVDPPPQTEFVARLLQFKKGGIFVEAGAYRHNRSSDTEWLERELNWHGLLIQPNPKDYLILRAQNRLRAHCIHACLSPTPYPKEVTFREAIEGPDRNQEYVFTRVKCFPLFSLLLAINATSFNYLSLDAEGAEIQVLKTIPTDRVHVDIIGVARSEEDRNPESSRALLEFMGSRKYSLVHKFRHMYLFTSANFLT